MSIVNKTRLPLSILAVMVFLSGCFHQSTPAERLNEVLEDVVDSEKGFELQQDPLISSEKRENDLYNQIIGLGMKQYDQIVKLSDEAISLADKRKVYMEKETESLKNSEKEFKKVEEIKDDFDDPVLKTLANDLYTIMLKRYRAHDLLYTEYSEALKYDKELYRMFKNKNLQLTDLEAQVNKLNTTYKKVFGANENFNTLTEQYNSKKMEFYQKAGLETKPKLGI